MQNVLTPDKMRQADTKAINEFAIPSLVLMENAARSAAGFITKILLSGEQKVSNLLILCGSGNNGGDGFALARHLMETFNVRIIRTGDYLKMSAETYTNFQAAERLGIPVFNLQNETQLDHTDFSAGCIIDSLIGVGGSENIKGIALSILKKVRNIDSIKIAIDAPTGLNTETGAAHEDCFAANHTVTMYAVKTGMLVNRGPEVCGQIHRAYLGAPQSIVESVSNIRIIEKEDLRKLIPQRKRLSSKFDYGRALVIAGSDSYPGAAALSANAAITAGAGLVQLLSTKLHHTLLADVIAETVESTEAGTISIRAFDKIMSAAEKANVLIIGPGLGDNVETTELVRNLISDLPQEKSIVIDADGLRAIEPGMNLRKNIILTPHTGEFSRLTGTGRAELEPQAWKLTAQWAAKLNCTIHLKHVPSVTSDGAISYWNTAGNPGMAKGGSGDVLTGVIAALLARGLNPLEAAAAGAFIHATAGDLYAERYSVETLTATELTGMLKFVI